MRDLTLICAYFENAGMLREQQQVWRSYPAEVKQRFHVIVVDDGSRLQPARAVFEGAGIASQRLYLAKVHRRWDWLFCRNLGAEMAETEWIILTDMDHVVPAETVRSLMTRDLDPMCAYRFCRVDAPHQWPYPLESCRLYKRHNDSWLLARSLFFHPGVGGYDERLSGCYGSSSDFTGRIVTVADDIQLPEAIIRYPREIIPDASTLPTVYTRKGDKSNDEELKRRKAARAKIPNWQPLRLTIPYSLETSCSR